MSQIPMRHGTHICRCYRRTCRRNTLQHTATHCNSLPQLQHTATHCNTLHIYVGATVGHAAELERASRNSWLHQGQVCRIGFCPPQRMWYHTCCNALQRTATHCNALQRTATHCNALQQISRLNLPCKFACVGTVKHLEYTVECMLVQ